MRFYSFLIGLVFASLITCVASADTQLLPEVEKLMDIHPVNDIHMRQNSYVYFMGMDALNDDYFSVGKKIVEHINKVTRESLAIGDQHITFEDKNNPIYQYETIKLVGEPYTYPCYRLAKKGCVQEIMNDLDKAQVLIKANKALLARYKYVIKLPRYDAYSPVMINAKTANFRMVFALSALHKVEAIEAIKQGEVQKGLGIFQQEIRFAKNILASNASMIDKMVAINLLTNAYHTLEELLDTSYLQNYLKDPQWINLLAALSDKEQQALASAFNRDLVTSLILYVTFDPVESPDGYIPENFGDLFDSKPFPMKNVKVSYDKYKTMNEAYIRVQPIIHLAQMTLPTAHKAYEEIRYDEPSHNRCSESDLQLLCLMRIWQRYGENSVGSLLLDIATPDYKSYFFRMYDTSTYLALIRVKFLIKQQHIRVNNIPIFLESLGDKAKNSYTKEPFIWNSTWSTLCTEGLSSLAEKGKSKLLVPKSFFCISVNMKEK